MQRPDNRSGVFTAPTISDADRLVARIENARSVAALRAEMPEALAMMQATPLLARDIFERLIVAARHSGMMTHLEARERMLRIGGE